MGVRSNRSSRSRREPRVAKPAPEPPKASASPRRKKRRAKTDPRGLEIERRASSIPPSLVHDVFDVSTEPPARIDSSPRTRREAPPPFHGRGARPHPHHVSKAPPAPPRPSASPGVVELADDVLEPDVLLQQTDSLPVLTAPSTDAPVAASPQKRPPWFALGAAAVLLVSAGIVLGARTRAAGVAQKAAPTTLALVHSAPVNEASVPATPAPLTTAPLDAPLTSAEPVALKSPAPPSAETSVAPSAPVQTSSPVAIPSARVASAVEAAASDSDAPAAELPPFDAASASSAIGAALERSARCRSAGEPGGSVTATLTYAPSGRVTSALVSGAFAGTSVGGCIAAELRSARVSAFSGEHVTVKRTIVLR